MKPGEALVEIYNAIKKSRDCIELVQKALIYNTTKPLDMTENIVLELSRINEHIMEMLKVEVKKNPETSSYIPVPDHLEKIRGHIQGITYSLKEKISKEVLFNDKSMAELNFLLEKLAEILNNTADLVLAKNTIILGYVKETGNAIAMSADSYETRHDEQLIEGIAPTMTSRLFIDILNSIRGISWHTLKIAGDLFV
jgi:Na+/phosphate symporter